MRARAPIQALRRLSTVVPPYAEIVTATPAFRGRHVTIGRFFAKAGHLDALLGAYHKHAFEPLRASPALVDYFLAKDEKASAFVTVSTWSSYGDCVAALSTPALQTGIATMRREIAEHADPDRPLVYEDLPVFASVH